MTWRECLRAEARRFVSGVRAYESRVAGMCGIAVLACALRPCAAAEDLSFSTLSIADGLPNENVTAFVQDSQGYLWIGTQAGLARYDGVSLREVPGPPQQESGASQVYVTALLEDDEHALWVGTHEGLYRLQPRTESWEYVDGPAGDRSVVGRRGVWALLAAPCDGREGIWVATNEGLKFRSRATGRLEPVASDAANAPEHVYALAVDRACRLWLGTNDGVLFSEKPYNAFARFPAADSGGDPSRVFSLLLDSTQSLWVGERLQTSAWDLSDGDPRKARLRFRQPLPTFEHGARHLIEDQRHSVWAASLAGLQRWDRDTGRVRVYTPVPNDKHTLPAADVMSVYQTRDHVLWVGTYSAGLARADLGTSGFRRYQHRADDPGSIVDDRVWQIAGEPDDGAIWIATSDGVSRLDRSTGVAASFRHDPNDARSLQKGWVAGLFVDGERVYLATDAGLDVYDGAQRTLRHLLTFRGDVLAVQCLTGDGNGTLYLGAQSGLYRIDVASKRMQAVTSSNGAARETPVGALLHEPGALWVGTDTGLLRLDLASGQTSSYRHIAAQPASISHDQISSIFRDRDGTLWIGTAGGGLNRARTNADGTLRFESFGSKDGFADDLVRGILQDAQGMLWVSSAKGLSRFDPATHAVANFSSKDGLTEGAFSEQAAYAMRDGAMYFAGLHGMVEFKPDEVVRESVAPQIALNGIEVFTRGERLPRRVPTPSRADSGTTELTLPHTLAVVAFDVAVLHFADPAQNRFRYRLTGFDAEWRVREWSQHVVTFTNLDPGTYRFIAEASSKDGVWGEPVSLGITVTPPFWRTAWFRTVAALCATALLYFGYRLRFRELERQRSRLEQQVAERTAKLRANEARLEEASRHKSEFLATMSHEIRTPMSAVIGLVHLAMREAGIGAKLRDYLQKIHTSAMALLRIIDDILDSSKIEAGRLEIETTAFALDDTLSHVKTVTGGRAADKGLELVFAVRPEVPAHLVGDPLRLGQVLINLINNAIKFTPRGRILVAAELERADDAVAWVRWSVQDSGIGMTPEQRAKLFQPFVQADSSIARQYGGTGLGLSISHRLVALMGGELGLESAPGVGSTFTFCLPFRQAPRAETYERATLDGADGPRLGPGRVLVVEDNAINQLIATELLAAAGLSVEVADSGQAAVGRVAAAPAGFFSAVLMDLQMPGMDGFAATAAIRKLAHGQDVPVLALTAHALPEVQQRCSDHGMQACMSKPFHPAQLFAVLARFLPSGHGDDGTSASDVPAALGAPSSDATPVFDAARGLLHSDGNEDLFQRVLQRFPVSAIDLLAAVRQGLEADDIAAVRRAAHTLRGVANTVGARRLGETAGRMEAACEAPDALASAMCVLEPLDADAQAALAAIAQHSRPEADRGVSPTGPHDARRVIPELRAHLARRSARALSLVQQGRGVLVKELGPDRARRLEALVSDFEFSEALRVLE